MKGINRRFYVNFKTLFRKFKDDFLSPQRLYLDFRDLAALILGGISSRKPYISKKVML
jgi:hypothetical protein